MNDGEILFISIFVSLNSSCLLILFSHLVVEDQKFQEMWKKETTLKEEISSWERKIAAKQKEISDKESELTKFETKKLKLENENNYESNPEWKRLQEKYQRLNRIIDPLYDDLEALNEEIKIAKQSLREHSKELSVYLSNGELLLFNQSFFHSSSSFINFLLLQMCDLCSRIIITSYLLPKNTLLFL